MSNKRPWTAVDNAHERLRAMRLAVCAYYEHSPKLGCCASGWGWNRSAYGASIKSAARTTLLDSTSRRRLRWCEHNRQQAVAGCKVWCGPGGWPNRQSAALVCLSWRAQPVVRRGKSRAPSHHSELSRSPPSVPAWQVRRLVLAPRWLTQPISRSGANCFSVLHELLLRPGCLLRAATNWFR